MVLIFGVAVVGVAPWIASWTAENDLPIWAAAYINHKTGSHFPIFPWTGFILMGVATAYWAEKRSERVDASRGPLSHQIGGSLAFFGGALALVSWLLDHSGTTLFPPHLFWRESPIFFGWRLGVLFVVMGALCWVQGLIPLTRYQRPSGWIKVMQVSARHTLPIYVAHLLILYGLPLNQGLIVSYGRRLFPLEASALAAIILASMIGLALGWYTLQRRRPTVSTWMQLPIFAGAFYYFFSQ